MSRERSLYYDPDSVYENRQCKTENDNYEPTLENMKQFEKELTEER